jgi:hypothetical protein
MTESDLRRWVRKELGVMAYWVEHARGGTVGLADCFVAVDERLVPVELKVGPLREKESECWWQVRLRPAQIQVGDRLWHQGVETCVLVGNEYCEGVWMMPWRDLNKAEGGWVQVLGPLMDSGELLEHIKIGGQ